MNFKFEVKFVTYIFAPCEVNPAWHNGVLTCYGVWLCCSQMTGLQS